MGWHARFCVCGRARGGLFGEFTFLFLTSGAALLSFCCCWKRQRLSRVAEGTGPETPQQPGASAKVLIPAQWGEIRSSTDRDPGH
jgi:hypothetical protein